jgi:uncharacterized protein YuzE
MQPRKILSYDPEVDIAMISIEAGRAASDEYPWGLIDRDPDTGRLMGFVLWRASEVLPAEMIAAMSVTNDPHDVAA